MHHLKLSTLAVIFLLLGGLAPAGLTWAADDEPISVRAAVEKQTVYVGESFVFQLQIEGSESPDEPQLTGLADFNVQFLGGQQNSSHSVSIVNGSMQRQSKHGYIYNYRLTPKKAGRLTIAGQKITIDGRTFTTGAIPITSQAPEENDAFKLRMQLEKPQCYVGEPVVLEVTWYISQEVKGFDFNLPLDQEKAFMVAPLPPPAAGANGQTLEFSVAGQPVVATQGHAGLDGQDYTTLHFSLALLPREPGTFQLPRATVACKVLSNMRRGRGMDPFDIFERMNRNAYQTVITPSNQPTLTVLPLPEAGQPADFSGLVGEYSLVASATPTTVRVGEPITLNVEVAGPAYLENVRLPPLHENVALARDFKIPEEMAPGTLQNGVKSFTQTLRVKTADVKAIPAIVLSFFNPASGAYETARTAPIPLSVAAARVVTAQDAEGLAAGPTQTTIAGAVAGIGYNYEGPELLAVEAPRGGIAVNRPALFALLLLPPLGFTLLWALVGRARRRRRNPAAIAARKAFKVLETGLRQLTAQPDNPAGMQQLAHLAHQYLVARLGMPAGALTVTELTARLTPHGIEPEVLNELGALLETFETWRFAGAKVAGVDQQSLADRLLAVARKLERRVS